MILDQRELQRRKLLRLKGIESGRPLIGPATVRFHLMDLCNLACRFCWEHKPGTTYRASSKNNLPYEVFESAARDCALLQVDEIHLSGLGEPTMHPRFYDILSHLEPSFGVTIFTNGTFPIERCRDILRADHVIINLGAADREGYRALYGRDLFIKVIKNIRELARLRPQFNPDFRIEVVIVVTDLNEANQSKTEKLVRKLGADLVDKKAAYVGKFPLADQEQAAGKGEWPPCYHGWFYSAINLNGTVNLCCFMERLVIGNVFTTSFKDIWESDEYSRARTSALTGRDPFRNDHDCVNCRVAWRNKEIGAQLKTYNRLLNA